MKHIFFYISVVCVATLCLVGCNNNKQKQLKASQEKEAARLDSLKKVQMKERMDSAEAQLARLPEEPVFDIVTSMGTIKVKLYSKTPLHRENFAKLSLSGFYDSTLFHRVINGFMIQGGDPLTRDTTMVAQWGTGGPAYTIPAEFIPEYTHKKGALCAARRGDAANPKKESSGSQFYIVQDAATCSQLNGEYTVYGETIDGFNVIDAIANTPTNRRNCPVNPVLIYTIKLDPSCLQKKEDKQIDISPTLK